MSDVNGWNEWSKHVLKELERLNENYEALHKDLQSVKGDLSKIKAVEDKVEELRLWKVERSEAVSNKQLEELTKNVDSLKSFKIVATTVWAVIQVLFGLFVAFKDSIL